MSDTHAMLVRATEAHRSGNFDVAESLYKQVLAIDKRNAMALHLLGVLSGQRGDLSGGVRLIERALKVNPDQPDILFNLGSLSSSLGQYDKALAAFRRAAQLRRDYADAHHQMALVFEKLGDSEAAEREYTQCIHLRPGHVASLINRAVIRQATGRLADAITDLKEAIRLSPSDPIAWINLAACHRDLKEFETSRKYVEQALRLQPENTDALWAHAILCDETGDSEVAERSFLRLVSIDPTRMQAVDRLVGLLKRGKRHKRLRDFLEMRVRQFPRERAARAHYAAVLSDLGDLPAAATQFEMLLKDQPDDPDTLANLAATLQKMGNLERARGLCEQAVRLRPEHSIGRFNLGVIYERLGMEESALEEYSRSILLNATFATAYSNRGALLQRRRRLDDAEQDYRRALELDGKHSGAKWNRGLLRLTRGDIPGAWEDYESRFSNEEFAGVYSTSISAPQWKGESLVAGSSFLVLHEQGLGDTIQFCRYLPLLAERGVSLSMLAPKPLHRLLRSLGSLTEISESIDVSRPFAFHSHLLSLPGIFGTSMTDIPCANRPYLQVDETLRERWRGILGEQSRPRFGVCWRGGSASKIVGRSMDLSVFSVLLDLEADFISLQKELEARDTATSSAYENFRHFGEEQQDFADAAAVISQVDLVLSVDTSIAHLAGALGKETWVLLPYAADWRWFESRKDSPWYSSVRLFRQHRPGDWSAPLAEVRTALDSRIRDSVGQG